MHDARDEAERTAALLESTVRASVDAIVVHDAEGRIATWGPAAEAIHGYTAEEAVGRPATDLIAPELREGAAHLIRCASAGEAKPPVESVNLDAAGNRIPVEVSIAPIRDAGGAPTGLTVAVIRDIRPRLRARQDAALLEAIVSNAEVAIYAFDTNYHLTTWSAGAERLFGWTLEEVAEAPTTLVPAEYTGEAVDAVMQALRGEHAVMETKRITKAGRLLDVHVAVAPVRDAAGTVTGASVIAQDISKRRAAEGRAERDATRMATVLRHVRSSVFLKDTNGVYLLVNQRFRELWVPEGGADPVGRTDAEIHAFGTHDVLRFRAEDEAVITTGETRTIEARFPDQHGVEHDFVTIKAPVRDADGTIVGVCGVDHEVTELRAAEHALGERAGELARSNADLDAFATAVSHDLQEPLRVVELAAQVLERLSTERADGEMGELSETIASAARRLIEQVDGLLELSRVRDEAGAPPAEPMPADAALDDALYVLQVRIGECDARIERGALPALRVDRTQLARIFQNLLSNALKFTADGESPDISIAARETEDGWEIEVADRGIGFDPVYADRIFAPFRTAHDRDRYPGLGVGLALCRRICERYGGAISARSELGAGATFTLRFPR